MLRLVSNERVYLSWDSLRGMFGPSQSSTGLLGGRKLMPSSKLNSPTESPRPRPFLWLRPLLGGSSERNVPVDIEDLIKQTASQMQSWLPLGMH